MSERAGVGELIRGWGGLLTVFPALSSPRNKILAFCDTQIEQVGWVRGKRWMVWIVDVLCGGEGRRRPKMTTKNQHRKLVAVAWLAVMVCCSHLVDQACKRQEIGLALNRQSDWAEAGRMGLGLTKLGEDIVEPAVDEL